MVTTLSCYCTGTEDSGDVVAARSVAEDMGLDLKTTIIDRDVIQTAMRISPRLKIEGENDTLRKRVHRQASVELGVPPYPDLNALTWMNRIDRIWEYDPKNSVNKENSVLS